MNGEKARGLVPPRPNLGPEPWREPAPSYGLFFGLAIAGAVMLLAAWAWRWRTLRSRNPGPAGGALEAEPGPRGRLVGLSVSIRDALTAQFGSSFRAKTTEEISADERLPQLLGEPGFRELVQFLDRIDRLKFAPEGWAGQEEELSRALSAWEPLMTAAIARIRARPRPRARAGVERPRRPV